MKWVVIAFFLILCFTSCENETASVDLLQLNDFHSMCIADNNNLLVAGEYNSKITFIKTNSNFKKLWSKGNYEWGNNKHATYGEDYSYVDIVAMFLNERNNFICIGRITEGSCEFHNNILLIELDQNGNEIQKKLIPENSVWGAAKTRDNGFILSGSKITKIDKNLNVIWSNDFWKQGLMVNRVIVSNDNYIVSCRDNNMKTLLIVLDGNGNITKNIQYHFKDNLTTGLGFDMMPQNDGGFIIAGRMLYKNGTANDNNGVIRITESGQTVWCVNIGRSPDDDWLRDIIYKSGNDLIIQGDIGHPMAVFQKSYLLKINVDGQILDSCTIDKSEKILYSPTNHFFMAKKYDAEHFQLSKVHFSGLFK